jgi:hypothetical protein
MKKITLTVLCLSFLLVIGCKKEDAKKVSKPVTTEKFMPSGELYSLLPEETIGVFDFNYSSKGSKEFIQSPWGKNNFGAGKNINEMDIAKNSPLLSSLLRAIEKSEIDITKAEEISSAFPSVLLFLKRNKKEYSGALLIKTDPKILNTKKLLDTIAEITKEKGQEVTAVEGSEIGALKTQICESESAEKKCKKYIDVYFAEKNGVIVVSLKEEMLAVVSATPRKAPLPIFTTKLFEEATANYPNYASTMNFGYFDNSSGTEFPGDELTKNIPILSDEQDAIQGASMVSYMENTPRGSVRILHKDRSSIRKIANSSQTGPIAFGLPEGQLGFVSFDGKFLANLADTLVGENQADNKELQEKIAILRGIKRIALSLRMAPAGQSILPIPDLVVAIETQDTEATTKQIKDNLATNLSQNIGGNTDTLKWSEVEISGNKAYSMQTPLGISTAIMAIEDVVIVTTSTTLLEGISKNIIEKKSPFLDTLNEEEKVALNKDSSTFNMYLDFEEVSVFLKNMSGMLAMYAPADSDTQSILSEENISSLKDMGSVTGVLETKPTMVEVRAFYSANKAPKTTVAKR